MAGKAQDPTQFDTLRRANKYRRAFTWRVGRGDAGSKAGATGLVRLATSDYPDILEDYLYISRRRHNNKTAIAKLQLQMLTDISVQERSTKHYKEKLSEVGAPQDSIKSQITAHELIANAIRQIGDGLAWRSFDYDRFTHQILCANAVKQTVLAEGTIAELEEWSSISDQEGYRAIINAVTNCISIGDITAVDANGNVELIEVKSGKTKSRRVTRQKSRLRDATGVLTTGTGIVEGKSIVAASTPITPRNYLPRLKALLAEAGERGWSSELVAPHCYVECVDVGKLAGLGVAASTMEEAYNDHIKQWGKGLAARGCSLNAIAFTPNVAPFSIFPFDERTCIELMIGSKVFTSYINAAEISKVFTAADWFIESAFEEAAAKTNGEAVIIMSKGGFYCHVPPADFAKLQLELLNPETLLEELESIRACGPNAAGGYGVWTFDGEATQWL
jgi:hypothetical protein